MSLFQDSSGGNTRHKTMSVNVHRLQESLNMHLDVQEKTDFVDALNEYHMTRSVPAFVKSLRKILDTPAKWQLIVLIRKVLPKTDVEVFDQFTRYDKKKYGTMPSKSARKGNILAPVSDIVKVSPTRKKRKQVGKKESDASTVPSFRDSHMQPESLAKSVGGRSVKSVGGKSIKSLQSAMKDKGSEVYRIQIKRSSNDDHGFGFSIRGGLEYGLGIYVSMVDKGGMAEAEGLTPGDLILEVNDIAFSKISHQEGAKIIRAAQKLELTICRVGRIPGSFVVHQMYKWVDPHGRGVSPPPELEQIGQLEGAGSVSRRSGFSLLQGSDERKVNVSVRDGTGLGLMIRGGREFGLGIYISGVDSGSMAENAGLKVGDQILDVNGQSFLDITHAEAVRVLKTAKHAIFTIKDVGKLPFARTTIDQTNWLNHRNKAKSDTQAPSSTKTVSRPGSAFSKGIGSQLMLNTSVRTKWDMIEDQARELLNETEQGTLRYYLSEYQKNYITVDGLAMASFELLNTKAKMTLMSEIRNWVSGRDLEKFDTLLQRRKLQQQQGFLPENYASFTMNGATGDRHREPVSSRKPGPGSSHDGLLKFASSSAPVSRATTLRERHNRSRKVVTEADLEPLRLAIEQIEDDPDFLPEFLPQEDSDTLTRSRNLSRSSEQLSSHMQASVSTMIPARRSMSVERLGPLTVDTSPASFSPFLPRHNTGQAVSRPRSNSSSSQRPRSGSNASQRHRSNAISRRQRPSSNSSTLTRMHRSVEDISAPPPQPAWTTPYPSHHGSMEDISPQLTDSSLTHLKHVSEFQPDNAQVVVAEVHNIPRAADGSPSDDSGVEVNGNHDNQAHTDRVTISADSPVDIDDVLERRSSVVPMTAADLDHLRHISPGHSLGQNPYNGGKLYSSKPYQTSDNFSLHRRPHVEIRLNDGEGSIDSLTYGSDRQPRFMEDYPGSQGSRTFEDEDAEIFELPSEMGDDLDLYVSPLDRVLDEEDYTIEGQRVREMRKKYGDIPLEIITVYKTKPTLGMAIEGGANTRQPLPRVINLQPGGSSYESGGLKVGHVILEVNDQCLVGLEHIEAAKMIAEAFKNKAEDHMELLVTEGDVKVPHPNVSNIAV